MKLLQILNDAWLLIASDNCWENRLSLICWLRRIFSRAAIVVLLELWCRTVLAKRSCSRRCLTLSVKDRHTRCRFNLHGEVTEPYRKSWLFSNYQKPLRHCQLLHTDIAVHAKFFRFATICKHIYEEEVEQNGFTCSTEVNTQKQENRTRRKTNFERQRNAHKRVIDWPWLKAI